MKLTLIFQQPKRPRNYFKNPKDVYIEIYKAARKKAKETREKAAQAFLEANIKKYNLTEIFDSDEEDEEESYLSNF